MAVLLAAATALAAAPISAATFKASNPQEAARAIVQARAGDTVALAPGHYGKLLISVEKHNQVAIGGNVIHKQVLALTGPATITSADPQNPAVLSGIDLRNSPYWQFRQLRVMPDVGKKSIAIRINAADIVLANNIFGYDDYRDWTTADWQTRAPRMVFSIGPRTQVLYNQFFGVFHGVILAYGADGSRAEGNTIRGLGGDGFVVSANGVHVINNDIANFYEIDLNHDDCLQAWAGPKVNQKGINHGLTVIGNRCRVNENLDYRPPSPQYPPMSSGLQAYVAFDGAIADCVIKNNWALLTGYHGVMLGGATNCLYEGNRVINATGDKSAWVRVSGSRIGRPPSGNQVIGNYANVIDQGRPGAVYSGNVIVSFAEYATVFADWRNGDLSLTSDPVSRPAGTVAPLPAPSLKQLPPPPRWKSTAPGQN